MDMINVRESEQRALRECVRSVLLTKLEQGDVNLFTDEDLERLGRNAFLSARALEVASENIFKEVLHDRLGLVGLLVQGFVQSKLREDLSSILKELKSVLQFV